MRCNLEMKSKSRTSSQLHGDDISTPLRMNRTEKGISEEGYRKKEKFNRFQKLIKNSLQDNLNSINVPLNTEKEDDFKDMLRSSLPRVFSLTNFENNIRYHAHGSGAKTARSFNPLLDQLNDFYVQKMDQGVSSITNSLNSKATRVWEYLEEEQGSEIIGQEGSQTRQVPLTPILGIDEGNSIEGGRFTSMYKEVTELVGQIKDSSISKVKKERVSNIVENTRQVIIKKKVEAVKERVDQRLASLLRSEEEYAKLEREISDYENQSRSSRKMAHKENRILKNKNIPADYKQQKELSIKKDGEKLERRLQEIRERKFQLDLEHKRKKEEINLKEELKMLRAERRREKVASLALTAELKEKWAFLVVFTSRYVQLATQCLEARQRRKEEERNRRMTNMIYTKMMPIVWKRRSIQWKSAWDVFRKHWILYRLYLEIKRRKESAVIIRTFLQDTNTSLILVRQVQMFRSKVFFAQRLIRKWYRARETRIAIASFQYSIMEARLLSGEKVVTSGAPEIERRRSKSSSRIEDREGKKKKVVTYADDPEWDSEPFITNEPFTLSRATYDMKRVLIIEDMRQKAIEYENQMITYRLDKRNYEHKWQQQMYFQKAKNIMTSQESRTNLLPETVSFTDENGKVIMPPTMPVFTIWRTEQEIYSLVQKGNKRLKEYEDRLRKRVTDEYLGDVERRDKLAKLLLLHEKALVEDYSNMRDFFSERIFDQYKHLFFSDGEKEQSTESRTEDKEKTKKKKSKKKSKSKSKNS